MPSLKAKRKRHLSEAFQTLPSIATPSSLPTVFFLFNFYLILFSKDAHDGPNSDPKSTTKG